MNGVFAIGSNGSGQLGVGHFDDVSVPVPVQFYPHAPSGAITQISAGGNHTLLLTEFNELYWTGGLASGTPGSMLPAVKPLVREIKLNEGDESGIGPVELIATTWETSVVVARDLQGRKTMVLSSGTGTKGEPGFGRHTARTQTMPMSRIPDFPPANAEVVCLAASVSHVVAVLDNGAAYGWGNSRKSQIGTPQAMVLKPRKIEEIGFKVTRAVCAREATCFFGSPDSGDICVLGSDKWRLRSKAPQLAPAWTDIGATWGNFYILCKDGSLLGWGRHDYEQLPPRNLPRLKKIATGSEHMVALSEFGDVLAWGWGEHGNCGPRGRLDGAKGCWTVVASPHSIFPGHETYNVGAGCATSWVCIRSI